MTILFELMVVIAGYSQLPESFSDSLCHSHSIINFCWGVQIKETVHLLVKQKDPYLVMVIRVTSHYNDNQCHVEILLVAVCIS